MSEKHSRIKPLSQEEREVVDAVREAEKQGRPVAAAAFKAMTREAQGRALRSQQRTESSRTMRENQRLTYLSRSS